MQVLSLGWDLPLEKEMVSHSIILTWQIAVTEEPGWLQSMGSQRVRHDWSHLTHTPIRLSLKKLELWTAIENKIHKLSLILKDMYAFISLKIHSTFIPKFFWDCSIDLNLSRVNSLSNCFFHCVIVSISFIFLFMFWNLLLQVNLNLNGFFYLFLSISFPLCLPLPAPTDFALAFTQPGGPPI